MRLFWGKDVIRELSSYSLHFRWHFHSFEFTSTSISSILLPTFSHAHITTTASNMESSDPQPVPAPAISSSPTSSAILFDTFLLLLLRLVYFFISRKFLHSTISPTLRDISQPETILPPTASLPTADSSRRSGNVLGLETEYNDETDDTSFTPVSSYPGSPAPISLTLTSSNNGSRRDDNPGYSSSNLPSYPSQGENTIELQAIGQKLKDASSGVSRKVLQLSHGKDLEQGPRG